MTLPVIVFDMVRWYEHVCFVSFLAHAAAAAVILNNLQVANSAVIYLVIAGGLYFLIGCGWMVAKRASVVGVGIFIGSVLFTTLPISIAFSLLTPTPFIVTVAFGFVLIVPGLVFSSLLSSTSSPALYKSLSSIAALLYAGGWIWSAYFYTGFKRHDTYEIELTPELLKTVPIGSLIALCGAVLGAVVFEIARFDHERTSKIHPDESLVSA